MVMIRLAMMEQETPHISEVLPGKKDFISSRTFLFFISFTLLYFLLCLSFAVVLYISPERYSKNMYIFIAAILLLLYIMIVAFISAIIKRYFGRKHDRLRARQKIYVEELGKLQELYENESI